MLCLSLRSVSQLLCHWLPYSWSWNGLLGLPVAQVVERKVKDLLLLTVVYILLNCCWCFRILWHQCISSSELLQSSSLESSWHSTAETMHKEKARKEPIKPRTILLMFCFPYASFPFLWYSNNRLLCIAAVCYIWPFETSSYGIFTHPALIIQSMPVRSLLSLLKTLYHG